ncbi:MULTISPECIES: TULIP family P47-like protein [unclassified Rhizobium]|uniref:TULIP family P47-like protein n=1 Tax=unclassified Rhizobium TaxID=2613769 RepID=UPI0007155747|nr:MULTISPECIES: TULIP family P47-like protein [unclassified Rhizobium]KQS83089.1 hypothetical protein ASG50_11835 [Rhizobium sp. Leaf386]KQS89024.1 hypothetical protein ASG42_14795 [Rhizobium sp. Leaf391]KQT92872.1 hypothetical protein ASG68_15985 [Rhizobium sp. Leaf453]
MNTFGWDTVFVVGEDRLNTLLRANSGELTLDFAVQAGGQASGKYAPWQIAQGGSNDIIHLKLEIAEGTLESNGKLIDIRGLTLIVATYLDWLATDDNKEELRLDYNKLGETGNEPVRGELTVIRLLDPNQVLSPEQNALLSFALGQNLVANAAQVRFVFATVNLIAPQTNSWLTPVKNSYGYFHREDLQAGYLAIFSVTTDRAISGLEKTVDPAAIPTETNATYVISDELFLKNVVAPGLARSFSTDPSAFAYDGQAKILRNTRRLMAKSVKSGAITYHPEVDQLEVRSGENALQTYCKGKADMHAGIMLHYTVDARNEARFEATDRSLTFLVDPSPKQTHNAKISWWFFIAGPIVILITEIVVMVISSDIAKDISDENRERLAFGRHPPSSILLGAGDRIDVTYMGVNSGLYLRGNV